MLANFINASMEHRALKKKLESTLALLREHFEFMIPEKIRLEYEGPGKLVRDHDLTDIRLFIDRLDMTPAQWDNPDSYPTETDVHQALGRAMASIHRLVLHYAELRNLRSSQDRESNIRELIFLMKQAAVHDTLKMSTFRTQNVPPGAGEPLPVKTPHATVKHMKDCGTTACLSGHVRLHHAFASSIDFSPRDSAACAVMDSTVLTPEETMAAIMDVPVWFANMMIYSQSDGYDTKHSLYCVPFHEVTPNDIILVLEELKAGKLPEEILEAATIRINSF